VPALAVAADALAPGEILSFVWQGEGTHGRDLHLPKPWKAYDLLPSGLTAEVAQDGPRWRITLTSRALAPYATVEADVPGRFSDNAVTLIPGTPVTITFTPQQADATPCFTFRDLHSATYGPPSQGV
jgi:beta-mannosidase